MTLTYTMGTLKFSPDGTKLINPTYLTGVELFDFDQNTGKVSNARNLFYERGSGFYSAEFSPSGKLVNIVTGNNENANQVLQYDLTAVDIPSTKTLIFKAPRVDDSLGAIQIAPDGKIYGAVLRRNFLYAIHNPDGRGSACDVEWNALYLGENSGSNYGLPNFMQSYFLNYIQIQHKCLGNTTTFSLTNDESVSSALWNFGDGSTSTDITAHHEYSNTGTYTVSVIINGGVEKTGKVTISAVPVATKPEDILACDSDNNGLFIFDLTKQDSAILNGQDPTKYGITYYSGSEPISHPTATPI